MRLRHHESSVPTHPSPRAPSDDSSCSSPPVIKPKDLAWVQHAEPHTFCMFYPFSYTLIFFCIWFCEIFIPWTDVCNSLCWIRTQNFSVTLTNSVVCSLVTGTSSTNPNPLLLWSFSRTIFLEFLMCDQWCINGTPLYIAEQCSIRCLYFSSLLFLSLVEVHLGYFPFGEIIRKTFVNSMCSVLCEHPFSFLQDINPWVVLFWSDGKHIFNLIRNGKTV